MRKERRNGNSTDKVKQTKTVLVATESYLLVWNEEKLGKDKQMKGRGCLEKVTYRVLGSKNRR